MFSNTIGMWYTERERISHILMCVDMYKQLATNGLKKIKGCMTV